MDYLIEANGILTLNDAIAKKIAEFERQINEAKKQEEKLKKAILEEMEARNMARVETDDLLITYIADTTREYLDTKALKEDLPTIYDEYAKITKVKSSIRIKVK